ncbi:MAG: sulfatase [Gemmatimonadetes bacterium]|nr:sulfatase [Gemmatimonadota bacterium]
MSKDPARGTESARGTSLEARTLLLVAGWAGLFTGLGEVALHAGKKYVLGDVLRISEQFVWMAPVADFVLFLLAAVLLLAAGLLWPRLRGARPVLFVFTFLCLLAWVLLPWRISAWAGLLLSAGIAWQLSGVLARRIGPIATRVRRIAPVLVTTVVILAGVVNGARVLDERRALAALPDAAGGGPNVLLIIWDTVRAASLSLHGHDRGTSPNLERLAARGVTFEMAIAPTSWTLPSHASMFTGRLPHQMSAAWYRPLDATHATVAEALAGLGYRTGGFAANTLYVDWEHGLARGFTRFESYRITPGQIMVSSSLGARLLRGQGGWTVSVFRRLLGQRHRYIGRKSAEQVNADFLEWLDGQPADRPFFAFLNLFDAHLPYAPPAPYDTLFEPGRPRTTFSDRVRHEFERQNFWDMPAAELAAEIAAYEGGIAYLDAQLAVLLDALERRGVLDNTLVIVTSDHGEEFGEHGDYEHGTNLYLEQTHVPLVVFLPGVVPEGVRVTEPVSLRDIAATILDFTGRLAPSFPGVTLASYWDGAGQPGGGPVVSELAPGRNPDRRMRSLFADGFHYIRNIDGSVELYDFRSDPAESTDLGAQGEYSGVLGRLGPALDAVSICDAFGCCCDSPPAARAAR